MTDRPPLPPGRELPASTLLALADPNAPRMNDLRAVERKRLIALVRDYGQASWVEGWTAGRGAEKPYPDLEGDLEKCAKATCVAYDAIVSHLAGQSQEKP